ncbi:hypothetical protein RRG08_026828 [Elysia crispata]|uniref:Uncharacterized protein n=1 Tax=Elysia crispata TaxID=231223 RepID=A0AAE0ZH17_9GAST|nr:hypothetical protein RRG08_026828 [Elysia crispata]
MAKRQRNGFDCRNEKMTSLKSVSAREKTVLVPLRQNALSFAIHITTILKLRHISPTCRIKRKNLQYARRESNPPTID